ncbi:MAG: PCRF domain-containing protein, partial [Oscillospiraceae bacterium]|nr:PCRF domain-containing protein [Oscillospiraceae bacterium]
MLEKLKQIEEKYAELEAKMASPEHYNDPAAVMKIAREQKELAPVAEAYREYAAMAAAAKEAGELLRGEGDAELKELAREELDSLGEKMSALEERM